MEFYNHITYEKGSEIIIMPGKDQESMMQSKMAADHYLPLTHLMK